MWPQISNIEKIAVAKLECAIDQFLALISSIPMMVQSLILVNIVAKEFDD
jgi:hypothetical protein